MARVDPGGNIDSTVNPPLNPAGGVIFAHSNHLIGTFATKYPPTSVEWTYNLNTSQIDTIGGQIIQILSINFDTLTITGQFGKNGIQDLRSMMIYFANYFSAASQGNQAGNPEEFIQEPMSLTYDGALDIPIDTGKAETWFVYPTSFPSFNRSLVNIAPQWSVTCEVFEGSDSVIMATTKSEIENIQRVGVGYTPSNVFSDPAGVFHPGQDLSNLSDHQKATLIANARKQFNTDTDSVWAKLQAFLPAYTNTDLESLIMMNGSLPTITGPTTTTAQANTIREKKL